ncbi:uncharacterized protein LOC135819614 isoform X2 [Sycon ciliatum]|uniref:uncharacterized protein LOC135819614 isoform X2 n=1 Tax=Sycon ciliatum TaxID=27933 RepID=UPI0031F7059D
MGVVSLIIRLVLNLAVGAGSVMILYGIVSSRHTILVIMGLVFLICSLIMALAASIVISVGVLISCRNIKDLTTVPCETFVFRHDLDDTEGFEWYSPMNIAQMGSWIVSGCCLFHLIFAIVDLRAFRKQKSGSGDITDPSDRVHILADPSTFEDSCRDDPPPPFEDNDPNATPRQAV